MDAVIVDGNFSRTQVEYLEPDDISGLIHTLSFIELFNIKRDIPFFLYTARKVLLQEICKNGELDYFHRMSRLIQKGNINLLVDKIIEDVEKIHSIEWMVKKKYAEIIKTGKDIEENIGENLHQFLLDEARDSKYNKSIDFFNQLRGMMERIMDCCKENEIIPSTIVSLNNFKQFFSYVSYFDKNTGKTKSYWKGYKGDVPNDDLMPIPIGYTIEKLIDIIQDGSHKLMALDLGVSDYVQESQTPFVFRSCLYQVMDVIRWYGDLNEKLGNGSYHYPTYKKAP